MTDPIIILDTNNLVARNTQVFPNARSPDGFPTGGMFGMIRSLRGILADNPHSGVIAAMDAGSPAFRREVCPEYKAQRAEARTPEDEVLYQAYIDQVKEVHHLLKPLGVVTARAIGWEGDDAIAALVLHRFPDRPCTIVSSDKDFIQLITADGRVTLFDLDKREYRDRDPWYVIARCMDPKASDNLDGVYGVGKVGAAKVIRAWTDAEIAVGHDEAWVARNKPLDRFLAWCEASKDTNKVAAKVHGSQQKMRANYRCTHLADIAAEVHDQLKFRRCAPDRAAFLEQCRRFGLTPLITDIHNLWTVYGRLTCPV